MKKHTHKFKSKFNLLSFAVCKCGVFKEKSIIMTINGQRATLNKYFKNEIDYLKNKSYYTKIEIL